MIVLKNPNILNLKKFKQKKPIQKSKTQLTKKNKRYKKEEQNLVKACMEYLQWKGYLVIRNNTGKVFINENGRVRAIKAGLSGSADIIACSPEGKFVAIECKSKKGRLTEKQKEFLQKVTELGGIALVVKDINELFGYF